jgi:hypothetical protein
MTISVPEGAPSRAVYWVGAITALGLNEPAPKARFDMRRWAVVVGIGLSALLMLSDIAHAADETQGFGRFYGSPETEWDPDGRHMTLLQDFVYEDQDAKKWTASKGTTIDGASIPQAFWWIIGGPFEGKYRNASVVHDAECTSPHKNDWRAVHRMFYNASRAGGVGQLKAKIMYMAVYHCGPRWLWNGVAPPPNCYFQRDDFVRGVVVLRKNPDITLEAIEAFTPEALASQVSDAELKAERERIDYRRSNGPGPFGAVEDYP